MSEPHVHSVEQHVRIDVASYDAAIRTYIPHYDEMLATAVDLLASLAPAASHVVELGGGTGALADAVLRSLAGARVTLLDVDPGMLAQARARLAPHGERVVLREASYWNPLPRCEAVVASLALHHVHALADKTHLYAAIRRALEPGGVFLNLDVAMNGDPRLTVLTFDRWAAAMGDHGIAPAAARRHFADWSREDRYFALHEELAALARAGFAHPECFWRRGPMAILGGLRERAGL